MAAVVCFGGLGRELRDEQLQVAICTADGDAAVRAISECAETLHTGSQQLLVCFDTQLPLPLCPLTLRPKHHTDLF